MLPDGIFTREILLGQHLINDHHERLGAVLVFAKISAAHQLCSQRLEIIRTGIALRHFVVLAMPRLADNPEPRGVSQVVTGTRLVIPTDSTPGSAAISFMVRRVSAIAGSGSAYGFGGASTSMVAR